MAIKLAVPTEGGVLCAHFGHCEAFYIATVEGKEITAEEMIVPPVHQPGLYPAWVAEHGVSTVIAGGIGEKAKTLFKAQNIQVIEGMQLKAPRELVTEFIGGSLVSGTNTCNHDHD